MIDMALGEILIHPPNTILELLNTSFKVDDMFCSTLLGESRLRNNYISYISNQYSYNLKECNVLITAGAKFCLSALLHYYHTKNDQILLPSPSWPAYPQLATHHSLDIARYDVLACEIDVEIINRIKSIKPKSIVLNFPHNPTGIELTQHELENILRVANEHNVIVLVDETLKEFKRSEDAISALDYIDLYKNLFVIDSLSKWFGMGGLRVGFVAANQALINKFAIFHDQVGGVVPTHIQSLASNLLESSLALIWLKQLSLYCGKCVDNMANIVNEKGYDVVGHGGLYLWVKDHKHHATKFIEVDDRKYLVMSGDVYGVEGYYRICPARESELLPFDITL